MAEWNKNKVEPSAINGGQEFTKKDNLAVNELNAIVNNSFFASEKAERAEKLAENAVRGNGTLVTIGGQVQGEWSADFAESERQKSKNLFDKNAVRMYKSMYGGTGNSNCGDLATHSGYFVSDDIYVYGLSNIILSGSIGDNNVSVFLDENKVPFRVDNRVSDLKINTFSVPEDAYYFRFECPITHINNNIQLEEGTVATDYQPYNGATVRDKQLKEAVEKRDLLYRQRGSVDIVSSSLDTLQKYYDLFENSPETIYYCDIGSLVDSNFRTLVGTPTGFGGYAGCFIKKVVDGFSNGHFGCYELHCVYSFSNKIAKSYIFMNANNSIEFSGWTVIGG